MKNLLIISLFLLFTIVAYSQQTMEEIYGNRPISAEKFSPITHKSAKGAVGIPFYTGFETGSLDTCFSFTSSVGTGRYFILQDSTNSWGTTTAQSGLYYFAMDCYPSGFNRNDLDLHLDLAGETQVILSFWWADFNDETHAEDGVWISDDGISFTKIIDLNGGSYPDLQWNYFEIDLDSAALANGISLSSNFVIRFSQYDDYWIHGGNDGHLYDNIHVYSPFTTDVSSQKAISEPIIYPNPLMDYCFLSYNIKEKSVVVIKVYDLMGNLYFSESFLKENRGDYNETIDFSKFESGMYLLDLTINDNTTIYKIIKY